MARSTRQSKILEIISTHEVETQEDLVAKLRACNFDVTQATISRDIKELGLIKTLSNESGKYKYSYADTTTQTSNKYIYMLKESVISTRTVKNLVLVKTLKGLGGGICSVINRLNIEDLLGSTYGEDTVMMVFEDNATAEYSRTKLETIINT
jgi:transcriptional regulator of arginine metabolism